MRMDWRGGLVRKAVRKGLQQSRKRWPGPGERQEWDSKEMSLSYTGIPQIL